MTCWPPTACKGRVRTEACGLSPFHHVALRDSPQLLPRTLGVVSGLTDAVAMSLRLFLNTGSLSDFCEGKTQVVIKLPLMPQPEVMFCILRGRDHQRSQINTKVICGPVIVSLVPCSCIGNPADAAQHTRPRLPPAGRIAQILPQVCSGLCRFFQEFSPGLPPVIWRASFGSILLQLWSKKFTSKDLFLITFHPNLHSLLINLYHQTAEYPLQLQAVINFLTNFGQSPFFKKPTTNQLHFLAKCVLRIMSRRRYLQIFS